MFYNKIMMKEVNIKPEEIKQMTEMKLIDMKSKKIKKILSEIELIRRNEIQKLPAKYIECGYKTDNILPQVTAEWKNFDENTIIGGEDNHCWIYFEFQTPKINDESEDFRLKLLSGYSGMFKSCRNPQCIMYRVLT